MRGVGPSFRGAKQPESLRVGSHRGIKPRNGAGIRAEAQATAPRRSKKSECISKAVSSHGLCSVWRQAKGAQCWLGIPSAAPKLLTRFDCCPWALAELGSHAL